MATVQSGKWLALGAGVFLVVQTLLLLTTAPISGIENTGWFLNSGRGVAIVSAACVLAGAMVGFGQHDVVRRAAWVVGGAVLSMVAVLFTIGAPRRERANAGRRSISAVRSVTGFQGREGERTGWSGCLRKA
jgi:hypothetical protein